MLKGILPVLPTMFRHSNDLDLDAQRNVIRFALEAGCDGLVFPGVASEYGHLQPDERECLIKQWVEIVDGSVPLVGGASGSDLDEVFSNLQLLSRFNVGIAMILAPSSLTGKEDAQVQFFVQIAEAFPDMEIMLQNAPTPIGAGMSSESLLSIVRSVPSIRYIKEEMLPSGPTMSAVKAGAPSSLAGVFGGGGCRYIVDELARGSLGAMPAVELTDLHCAIYQAFTSNDFERARHLYGLSLPLLTSQVVYRMRLTKHVLKQRGVADATHVRAALPELDHHCIEDIDSMLEDLRRVAVKTGAFDWTDFSNE